MPKKSLHLIHLARTLRGKVPPRTLTEIRAKIKLPFKPDHVTEEEVRVAVESLPKKG